MDHSNQSLFIDRLQTLGQSLPPIEDRIEAKGVPAAVLAPLVLPSWDSNVAEARFLFIKRSEALKKHAGQMAFPGGVMEQSDPDLLSAGFREGWEEVGFERDKARLLASLPCSFTPSGFSLKPFFVATTQNEFQAQESEVDSIHLISVKELLTCPVRLERKEWGGVNYRVIYFDTSTVCIWGVTGRITEVLLTHFFAWKPPQ